MELTILELRILEALMKHSRNSCHTAGEGNAYFNEFGVPRCEKCALQYRINHGEWPHGANLTGWKINAEIRFQKDGITEA
jgi:hypothetical protein